MRNAAVAEEQAPHVALVRVVLGYSLAHLREAEDADIIAACIGEFRAITFHIMLVGDSVIVRIDGDYKGVLMPLSLECGGPVGSVHRLPSGGFLQIRDSTRMSGDFELIFIAP